MHVQGLETSQLIREMDWQEARYCAPSWHGTRHGREYIGEDPALVPFIPCDSKVFRRCPRVGRERKIYASAPHRPR